MRTCQPHRNKTRVVHLVDSLDLGGAQDIILSLATYRNNAEIDLAVCCLQEWGPLRTFVEEQGVLVTALGQRNNYDWRILPRLVRFLARGGYHIVHTHMFAADFWGRLASLMAKAPIRVSSIVARYEDYTWKNFMADRFLARYTDMFISNSTSAITYTIGMTKVPAAKLIRINNPVAAETFCNLKVPEEELESFCARWGIDRAAPVIGIIARLHNQKGHLYFFHAAKRILERVPEAQFLIVGDGPLRSHLEALAHEIGLGRRAVFTGYHPNLPLLYSLIDVKVLSSLWEGNPLVLIQAMMAGIPVVATTVDGIQETIVNGRMGILVPPRDHEALAEAVLTVLSEPRCREMLVKVAREKAIVTFDAPNIVRQYEAVYENLMIQKGLK